MHVVSQVGLGLKRGPLTHPDPKSSNLPGPVYFTEPIEIDYYMRKLADRELVSAECTLESARLFVEASFE